MKPNFLVIGAPKAATTAICRHLSQHPEVFFSHPKEPFFFAYDDVYERGWSWYEQLFSAAGNAKAIGEGSTVYAQLETFPKTLERISRHLDHLKIIYAVREPLERIRSHWIELHSQGLTMLPFDQAVREDFQYIDASCYHRQLTAYESRFGPENVLVLFYDDFSRDPASVMRRCFEFLEVDPHFQVPQIEQRVYASEGKRADLPFTNFLRHHVPWFLKLRDYSPARARELAKRLLKRRIDKKPEWTPETRRFLIQALKADTAQFLTHVGRPADFWPSLLE